MSKREVIFLGTASQVPTRARNHNAFFVRWDDLGILFDPGEGTQRQMTHAGLAASQITHIAITHFHGDHCLGLASIIQRISLDRVPQTIPVFYPKSGQVYFDRLRHASIFYDVSHIEPRPIEPGDRVELIPLGPLARKTNATFFASALEHGVECFGYRIEEPNGRRMNQEKLEALGIHGPDIGKLQRNGELLLDGRLVRIEEVSDIRLGQSLAVVMDSRPCAGAELLAKNADLLVCESTYLSSAQDEAHERGHMTSVDAAKLAKTSGARRLVLTHFSQRFPSTRDFAEEARAIHADSTAADDFTIVGVPPRQE